MHTNVKYGRTDLIFYFTIVFLQISLTFSINFMQIEVNLHKKRSVNIKKCDNIAIKTFLKLAERAAKRFPLLTIDKK